MENQSPRLADLVTILYRPRETMRRILDGGRDRWSIQIVILAYVCAAVTDSDIRHVGEVLSQIALLPVIAIVAVGIVVGAATWVLALFILSWIATPIGKLLGGTASFADVRAALGWGMAPIVWSVIYRVPIAVLVRHFEVPPQPNVHAVLLNFVAHGGCSMIVVYLGLQLLFALWCIVVGSFTLAEAQRSSTQKGFVNLAISLALPLLVIGAAVFTFRR